jgi:hypothetical protein
MESTRYGLKGSAKISGFWSAGFRIEAESKEAASQQLNEFNDDNSNNASGPIKMRWSYIYLANKNYGRGALGSDHHAEMRRDQGHLGVHLDPSPAKAAIGAASRHLAVERICPRTIGC